MGRKMNRRFYKLFLGAAPVMVAGCGGIPEVSTFGPAPKLGDDGIVVAESYMGGDTTSLGPVNDCTGPGMGVGVQGSFTDDAYQYDDNGEPCRVAELLFDGGSVVGKRPADPGITVAFHDNMSMTKPTASGRVKAEKLEAIPSVEVKSELLRIKKLSPSKNVGDVAAPVPLVLNMMGEGAGENTKSRDGKMISSTDPLLATLTSWQKSGGGMKEDEANAAAKRQLDKLGKGVLPQTEEDGLAQLSSKLREREREIEEERRLHAEMDDFGQASGARSTAANNEWQRREGELKRELESNRQRLDQLEQLAQRLKAEKDQKERAYQAKISTLSADLQAAQAQAETSRRNLILQAAAKISEAEQIARAAKMQEQDIKLREAMRLREEADEMMDKALSTGERGTTMGAVPAAMPKLTDPLLLSEAPVLIHAKNQSLEDLLATVLKQAEARAGVWKADWQLSPGAQKLLKEKWSLTAEASVQQVLAQITQQVKAKHGLVLSFTQFNKSRLLVVTDGKPQATE